MMMLQELLLNPRDGPSPVPPPRPDTTASDMATRAGVLVGLALCTIFVWGRIYARLFILHDWGWDDSSITVAWVANVATSILWCLIINVGQMTFQGYKFQYVSILTYEIGQYASQLSILFFYLRLLPCGKTRTATIGTLVLIFLTGTSIFLSTAFGCNPQTGLFPFSHDIACVPALPLLCTATAWAVITDLWIMAIIIPVLLKLDLPGRQKAALVCLMTGGIVVIISAVLRVIIVLQGLHHPDQYLDIGPMIVWSCVQLSLGILCVAAPGAVPLLKRLFPRAMASLTGTRHVSNTYGARSGASRIRAMEGAVELNYTRDQSIINSNVVASRSQPKKGWYSSQMGEHESQEDVLATGSGINGILKTSEVVFSETRAESDEDWTTDGERGKGGV